MYRVIEKCASAVVSKIGPSHVTEYEWLLDNPDKILGDKYQRIYRNFWAMNAAFPTPAFCDKYFSLLDKALKSPQNPPTLTDVVKTLYPFTVRTTDRGKTEPFPPFSFATKLLHMTNTTLPVYDKWVVGFYFLRKPTPTKRGGGVEGQIADYVKLHDFLIGEYARILGSGLLSEAIEEFENRKSRRFSKEKVIDSLIWAFAGNSLLQTKEAVYE
jgi:hypothetical protein